MNSSLNVFLVRPKLHFLSNLLEVLSSPQLNPSVTSKDSLSTRINPGPTLVSTFLHPTGLYVLHPTENWGGLTWDTLVSGSSTLAKRFPL